MGVSISTPTSCVSIAYSQKRATCAPCDGTLLQVSAKLGEEQLSNCLLKSRIPSN